MKIVSTETNYIVSGLPGLSQAYELAINTEIELSDDDAVILLTLSGVVKAQTELLNVEIDNQTIAPTVTSKAKPNFAKE